MKQPPLRSHLPLRHVIPLIVLGFGLLWTAVSTILHLRSEKAEARERVLGRSLSITSRLARLGAEGPHSVLQWDLQRMSEARHIRWAVLCDGNFTTVESTQSDWKGKPLEDKVHPDAMQLAQEAASTLQPARFVDNDTSVWVAVPVPDEDGKKMSLLALVEHDLSQPLFAESRDAWKHALIASGVQVAGCAILWLVLRLFLQRRMSQVFHAGRSGLLQAVGASPSISSRTDEFSEIFRVLNESENRLDQIADNIQDVFFLTTLDKKVIYVSPAYTRLFGIEEAELLNNSAEAWKKAVLPEYHARLWEVSNPLLDGAPEVEYEFRIRRPDGTLRWVELRMFPVRDERGGLINMAGLSRDVTDRKELEQEILDISERERRRIGNDIHDDLCQRLVAIKLKGEVLNGLLEKLDPALARRGIDICGMVGESTRLCRDIARGLSPMDLVGEGFVVGIDKLVKSTEALHDIPCFFYCPHTVLVESPSAAVHLYRITQEFLNNAVRHGNPSSIEVRLEMNLEYVRIEVANDGKPYPGPGPSNTGLGLKIQGYRAATIGAELKIQARSDGVEGTMATCIAPHSACNPDSPSSPT